MSKPNIESVMAYIERMSKKTYDETSNLLYPNINVSLLRNLMEVIFVTYVILRIELLIQIILFELI